MYHTLQSKFKLKTSKPGNMEGLILRAIICKWCVIILCEVHHQFDNKVNWFTPILNKPSSQRKSPRKRSFLKIPETLIQIYFRGPLSFPISCMKLKINNYRLRHLFHRLWFHSKAFNSIAEHFILGNNE